MELSKFSTLSTLFAFLMVVTAKIVIPINEVSIPIQIFIVVLSSIIGGSMIGLTAQLIYLIFGLFIPVFNGHELVFAYFSKPANFFVLLFPFISIAIGSYVKIRKPLYHMILIASAIISLAILVYALANGIFSEDFLVNAFFQKNTAMLISYFIETYIAVILCYYWFKYNKLSKK